MWAASSTGSAPLSQVEGGVLLELAFALMENSSSTRPRVLPVNATLDDYKLPTFADMPEIVADFVDVPDENLPNIGAKGLGEPPIIPTAAAVRTRSRTPPGAAARLPDDRPGHACWRRSAERLRQAAVARRGARAARQPGRRAARRRHRPGRPGRPRHRRPELLVDLQDTGLGEIDTDGDSLLIGAGVTLATLAEKTAPLQTYAAVSSAASLAASPLLRNVGTK